MSVIRKKIELEGRIIDVINNNIKLRIKPASSFLKNLFHSYTLHQAYTALTNTPLPLSIQHKLSKDLSLYISKKTPQFTIIKILDSL